MKFIKKIKILRRVTKLEKEIEILKNEINAIRDNNIKVYSGLSNVSYIQVSGKYKDLLNRKDELATLKRYLVVQGD